MVREIIEAESQAEVRLGLDMRTYPDFCRWKGLFERAFAEANELSDTTTMARIGMWNDELEATNPCAADRYKTEKAAEQAVPKQR